ncbi:MAG: efflux RND transporter periplasmic adaptor subunit [Saprospiraceae bacterium]|jgi:RND family efflux transporter MFP subunit|nr:MAG: RND transporter [Candidatus Parvibacillus calidus]MBX2936298.1 efflux RND transporter periplasmic adaptor subunit [Saprospiraceae bacterium]MBX7179581.1 efflux RND transporter periplasmic adaptor subunit [Saprospiraceae bacterium]MCB0589674.1 efflux RND transporter periplasmic adaptor subunit [Saprospiraceae bacterium]MCO5283207.1 efflux RND transporter periplasmic adaptor subunit [Saprospiraceae bacterium]
MKNNILLSMIILTSLSLVSCSNEGNSSKSLAAKQKALDKKIALRSQLDKEIEALEKEIAALDTTSIKEVTKIVGITNINTGSFSSQVEVMGKVDVANNASLSAAQGGIVTHIFVKEGDHVKTGQTLAQLDNDVMNKSLIQARQAVAFTTDLFNKQKALWDQKIGSEVQYLNAKNNMESAQNQLNIALQQNELFKIKAIYSGVVDLVDIKKGQVVAPGMPAFRIVATKGLKLIANVPESYIGKIKQGNTVQVYFPDLNKEITGKVDYLSRVIDPLSRTINAEILLPDNQSEIKTNMVGILRIKDYNNANAITIPVKNLLKNAEGYYVFIAEKSGEKLVAKPRQIKTGAANGDKIEVTEGLKAGDQLITTGFQSIHEGDVLIMSE